MYRVRRVTALCWLALPLLLLHGCVQMPTTPPPERIQRESVQIFALQGRFSVRFGQEGLSGRIAWSHRPESDHILLMSSLGQTMAQFASDASGATLELSDGRRYQAPTLDELASDAFGRPLPLQRLPGWALGKASPSAEVRKDELGRVLTLSDDDWQVDYLAYEGETPNALPNFLRLTGREVELKLRLDGWSVQP